MKFFFVRTCCLGLMLALGLGCESGQSSDATAMPPQDVISQSVVPVEKPSYTGPKVVLPLTEQSQLALVQKRYAQAGLSIDTIIMVPNPLKDIVLKAQWERERVREGDSVPVGATLRLWVGDGSGQ